MSNEVFYKRKGCSSVVFEIMSAKHTRKNLTAAQMRSVIPFLIGAVILLIIAVIILAALLASRKKDSVEAVSLLQPNGSYTVCVDPGHGGSDVGAEGLDGIYEKDGNLELSLKVAALLKKQGVTVVMTRDDDTFLSLSDRAAVANDCNADLFLAIHRNYAENADACGVEAWIYSGGSDKNYAIAEDILDNLESVGVSKNRGVRAGTQTNSGSDYAVIKLTNMPSLILEMGFVSNKTDVSLFEDHMDDYAAAIANGIIAWLNEYAGE